MRFFSHILPYSLVVTFILVTLSSATGTFTPLENPNFNDPVAGTTGDWILTADQGGTAERVTDVYATAPASIKLLDPDGSTATVKSNCHNAFFVGDIDTTTGNGWPVLMKLSCKTKLAKGTGYLGYAIVLFETNVVGSHAHWIFIGDVGSTFNKVSSSSTDWTDFSSTTDIGADHDTGGTISFKNKVLQMIKVNSVVKPMIVIDVVGFVSTGTLYLDDFNLVQTTTSVLRPVSASEGSLMSSQIRISGNIAQFSQTTPYEASVQNAQGRTVLSTSGTNNMVLIRQDNLASGAYLVTVKTGLLGSLTKLMTVGK